MQSRTDSPWAAVSTFMAFAAIVARLAMCAVASQSWNPAATSYEASLTALSPKCASALKGVYADKELDRCLNFSGQRNFTHLFFDNRQNQSLLQNAAIFSVDALCGRPACSQQSIQTNLHALSTSCTQQDLNTKKSPGGFLVSGMSSYPAIRTAGCLTNNTAFEKADSSINGHPLCFAQLLDGVERTKGVTFDLPTMNLLFKGDQGLLAKVLRKPESDQDRHVQLAAFCNDCLKAEYSLVRDVKNSKVKNDFVKTANDLCGANFLNDKYPLPKTVSQSADHDLAAAGGSHGNGSSSTTGSGMGGMNMGGSSDPGSTSSVNGTSNSAGSTVQFNSTDTPATTDPTTNGTTSQAATKANGAAPSVRHVQTGMLLDVLLFTVALAVGPTLLI